MGTHGVNGANGAHDTDDPDAPTIIRRSDMGLAISGTRISIYDVVDYLHDGWTNDEICDALTITTSQLQAALDYIESHREEVEAEFADVVRAAEERRRYHEERLRQHLASLPPVPPTAEQAIFYKKLAEQRGQLLRELWERIEDSEKGTAKAPRP
jgi:uncharacterized protein (DUF433 family)